MSTYKSTEPCSSFLSWLDMQLYILRADSYINRLDTIYPYADRKLAEYLDSKTAKEFISSMVFTPTVWSVLTSRVRGIYGLEMDQLNALFALTYIKSSGGSRSIMFSDEGSAQESRIKGRSYVYYSFLL